LCAKADLSSSLKIALEMMQFLLSDPFFFCRQLGLDWKDNLCHVAIISEILRAELGDLGFFSQLGKDDNAKH